MEITIMQNKYKTLITGGCSFYKRADLPIMKESEKTWTNALEESQDFTWSYHTGEPASGNSLISKRVIKRLKYVLDKPQQNPEDILVVVMWSDPIRRDLFASKNETYKWPELTKNLGTTEPLRLDEGFNISYNSQNRDWGYLRSGGFPSKDGYTYKEYAEWMNTYYENFYTDEYSIINTYESILSLQWFLKINKIKYIFHTMKNIFTNKDGEFLHKPYSETHHLWDLIDKEKFVHHNDYDGLVEYAEETKLPMWDDNLHVKWDGHQVYFNNVLKKRVIELI